MRERKYVKFRVDMYEDTKFKIIDMKPDRDVIHYIWNRLVLLAGKVNLEGDLFLSKSIPYTIETLAIEFNRDIAQVKLALEVFIELEMIELTEEKVYRVKNFAKHQNIKVKEKTKSESTEIKNNDVHINKDCGSQVEEVKHKVEDSKTIDNEGEDVGHAYIENLQNNSKDIVLVNDSLADKKSSDNLLEYDSSTLERKKKTRNNRRKKGSRLDNEDINEIATDYEIIEDTSCVIEGVRPLEKGEKSILEISFV